LKSIEVFDYIKSEWSLVHAQLPLPLKDFCAVSLPEGILIIGGTDIKN
jgi:hypothetical protein